MTIEELRTLYSILAGFGFGTVIGGMVVILIVKFYLSSYLSEKGRNLATKEDIAGITARIEAAREPFKSASENLKARHQLRVAALDKRLQAHQEAFTLWRDLLGKVYSEDIQKMVIECQTWWEGNCLYLEPSVRQAFVDSYSAAAQHGQLLKVRSDVQQIKDNWQRITSLPDVIFAAIQLPGLSELETKELKLNQGEAYHGG